MKVVFSRPALAELDEILGYLFERSPVGAAHVEQRIRSAMARMTEQPEAAMRVEQRPAVRRLPLGRPNSIRTLWVVIKKDFGLRHSED